MKAANRSKRITTQPVFMMAHLGAGYESGRIQSSLSNHMTMGRRFRNCGIARAFRPPPLQLLFRL